MYFTLEEDKTCLVDKTAFNRRIQITHHHADSIVLESLGRENTECDARGYGTMVCIETARLEKLLQFGESISAEISALPADI